MSVTGCLAATRWLSRCHTLSNAKVSSNDLAMLNPSDVEHRATALNDIPEQKPHIEDLYRRDPLATSLDIILKTAWIDWTTIRRLRLTRRVSRRAHAIKADVNPAKTIAFKPLIYSAVVHKRKKKGRTTRRFRSSFERCEIVGGGM